MPSVRPRSCVSSSDRRARQTHPRRAPLPAKKKRAWKSIPKLIRNGSQSISAAGFQSLKEISAQITSPKPDNVRCGYGSRLKSNRFLAHGKRKKKKNSSRVVWEWPSRGGGGTYGFFFIFLFLCFFFDGCQAPALIKDRLQRRRQVAVYTRSVARRWSRRALRCSRTRSTGTSF